jgi:hypothetical protein
MSSAATAAEAGVFVVLAVGRVDGGGTTGVLAVACSRWVFGGRRCLKGRDEGSACASM